MATRALNVPHMTFRPRFLTKIGPRTSANLPHLLRTRNVGSLWTCPTQVSLSAQTRSYGRCRHRQSPLAKRVSIHLIRYEHCHQLFAVNADSISPVGLRQGHYDSLFLILMRIGSTRPCVPSHLETRPFRQSGVIDATCPISRCDGALVEDTNS
jgi:hypothetical protein